VIPTVLPPNKIAPILVHDAGELGVALPDCLAFQILYPSSRVEGIRFLRAFLWALDTTLARANSSGARRPSLHLVYDLKLSVSAKLAKGGCARGLALACGLGMPKRAQKLSCQLGMRRPSAGASGQKTGPDSRGQFFSRTSH